jgi:hypothetical protein
MVLLGFFGEWLCFDIGNCETVGQSLWTALAYKVEKHEDKTPQPNAQLAIHAICMSRPVRPTGDWVRIEGHLSIFLLFLLRNHCDAIVNKACKNPALGHL